MSNSVNEIHSRRRRSIDPTGVPLFVVVVQRVLRGPKFCIHAP